MWLQGGYTRPTIEEYAIVSAAAQGYCNALEELLNLQFDQLVEANNE